MKSKSNLLRLKLWVYIWVIKNLNGYSKIPTKALYAQSVLETGWFDSPVFNENKNLFGMRHPKKRETLSIGSNLNHAVFKTHWDSISDYFKRQKYFGVNDTDNFDDYVEATVKSGYAEAGHYDTAWTKLYKEIKAPISNSWIWGSLFFLVLVTILIIKNTTKK